MGNPALDEFSRALFWKAGTVIILCGIGAIVLRELLQWLERGATWARRSLRSWREMKQTATEDLSRPF